MAYPAPPLNHSTFRILHLQPGKAGDAIHFRLEVKNLSDQQSSVEYEAISYVWGNPELDHEIYYNDKASADGPTALLVSRNCYQALKSLRLPDKSRTLWMDAVCINQMDIEERNAQVLIMGLIYSGARRVIAYLGESADDSDSVMKWLLHEYHTIDYPRSESSIEKPPYEAKKAFADRPWFSRIWILQEVANAREVEVMCGDLVIPWAALSFSYPTRVWTAVWSLREVQKVRASRSTTFVPDFLKLLHITRKFSSSDPRDKIYALLPLMPTDVIPAVLRPNYHIDIHELLIAAARLIYDEVGPRILYYAANTGAHTLPTWVPDWAALPADPPSFIFGVNYENASAGGEPAQQYTQDTISDATHSQLPLLSMKGIYISPILHLTSPFRAEQEKGNTLMDWKKLADNAEELSIPELENAQKSARPFADIQTNLTAFQRLILHDGMGFNHGKVALERMTRYCSDYYVWPLFEDDAPMRKMNGLIFHCCNKRRFAVLDSGMLALVPEHTELSDVIYVLHGAPFPFVLRKHGNHYKLIGECFVQGIMYGEAVDGVEVSSMETVVLE